MSDGFNPFNTTLRPDDDNIHMDRAHGDYPEHLDMTRRLPDFGGSDQVRVNSDGDILDGTTHIGKLKLPWEI